MKKTTAPLLLLVCSLFLVSYGAAAFKKVANIDQKTCVKCGTCFKACPVKAISKVEKNGKVEKYVIDPAKCVACGTCIKGCPTKAIAWAQYDAKADSVIVSPKDSTAAKQPSQEAKK